VNDDNNIIVAFNTGRALVLALTTLGLKKLLGHYKNPNKLFSKSYLD